MTGGSREGEGPSTPGEDICSKINFDTAINSPKPQIISRLKKGDILQVDLREDRAKTFIAVLHKDEIAGSITERIDRLASCIREGYTFVAEVLSIDGGKIKINIRSL